MAWYECFVVLFVISRSVSTLDFKNKCHRLCTENEGPKTCFYQFIIGLSQSKKNNEQRLFLSINGKRPGPAISVCQNDTILVEVHNRLPWGLETSLHWHGFPLDSSPFMDGVPMITQCPIFSRTKFTYKIQAIKSGTFYYRAHSVPQQLDGIYGPLIVNDANRQAQPEKIVLVSAQMKNLQIFENDLETDLEVTGLQLNVLDNTIEKGNSKHKASEIFRIINAAALDCPIRLFTHVVPFRVIAVDGNNVKPHTVTDVVINPGERIDLLMKSEVAEVIHIRGYNKCKGHSKYGLTEGTSEKMELKQDEIMVPGMFTIDLEPENFEKPLNLKKDQLNVFLPFDLSVFNANKEAVDFRYKLGEITTTTPSFLTKTSVSVFQFRNRSFLYPPTPILSQPQDVPHHVYCDSETLSPKAQSRDEEFCECLEIIKLPQGQTVDLFLIDEGRNGNTSQTFYLHGHSFLILTLESYGRPISGQEIENKEISGEVEKNLVNPLRKNTVTVPNKGFAVIRFKTDNPAITNQIRSLLLAITPFQKIGTSYFIGGHPRRFMLIQLAEHRMRKCTGREYRKWLLESIPSKAQSGFGLEIILDVEDSEGTQLPPKGFPSCKSVKEPDLVFGVD